jgi:gas vesicle protein
MNNEKSNIETKLSYLLIGGGIGAVLALLFAPKAGEELRSDIADATRKGLNKTEEIAGQLSETAQTVYAETKTKAGEIYDSAKQTLNSAENALAEIQGNLQNGVDHKVDQISHVIEAGRKEYDREDRLQGDRAKGKTN